MQPYLARGWSPHIGTHAWRPTPLVWTSQSDVRSLQGEQHTNGDQFARIQFALTVLGPLLHLISDKTENLDDNVFSGHTSAPAICQKESF
jgi:hypothetical protein